MWIVKLALRRPYSSAVLAVVIVAAGILAALRMPSDILPTIDIPVVSVIWGFGGVSPEEMERRIVTVSERAMTTTVNNIEHIESQSLSGISVIKVFFQPGTRPEAAVAEISAINQTILRIMPPGITPPFVLRYSASNVPILQAAIDSEKFSEAELYDFSQNFIRTQLATIQGAQLPLPYGGKPRQVMIDLDPEALYAKGLSPADITAAITAQNLILPAGNAKIGTRDYVVRLNSSPEVITALSDLPIRQVNGAMVYLRDVAQVRDGFAVQTNIVRVNGRKAALLSVLKSASASTLDIVERVKQAIPNVLKTLPPELKVDLLFDQSIFVRAALVNVLTEAAIAATLTALMILLFLGSWRSTLCVVISIPLSILCSVSLLYALGQTINAMTLGGLALAVGILVDDATVEIENIHRNLGMNKPLLKAILDGADQIAVPALVSTLAICIVFLPVFFLAGAARSLFSSLAMAVVFAMLASYFLSRTLVPTLTRALLAREEHVYRTENGHGGKGPIWAVHRAFNHGFEAFRRMYVGWLDWALAHRVVVLFLFAAFCAGTLGLAPLVGEDFFPTVDAGLIRLHVRGPSGTRIEETERIFGQVGGLIREVIPPAELETVLDIIGLSSVGVNLAFSDGSTVGPGDGEILIALKEGHGPTAEYVRRLRHALADRFPELTCYFQAPDIVNQILNFGLPAPIDIQVVGFNQKENLKVARRIEAELTRVSGAVDVRLHQIVDAPELRINVDRTLAQQVGMTQRDVANSLLVSLSSSAQVAPNYWINPKNGVNYIVAAQTPQRTIDSVDALMAMPVAVVGAAPQLLGNLALIERRSVQSVINHYNVQPVYDVFARVEGRDMGSVASEIDRILERLTPDLPRGTTVKVRGQVESMRSSFVGLGWGLLFAVALVYVLMAVNFQSWLDPMIILMALPGALAGIIWMLLCTGTTWNVPSLMGATMSVGVATANSILMVTFANDQRRLGRTARDAALLAGSTRLRPVLMTALAMILGMLPMSLGLGEGGEQNAPLGRAVIGGLLMATVATLLFVPLVYSMLRRRPPTAHTAEEEELLFS